MLEAGILEIFLDKIPQETKFKFNGISNEAPQDLLKGETIIFNHKDQEQINLKIVKIKNEIYHIFKDNLYTDKAMEINPKGLYKFHKSKDSWKLKEDRLVILLQNIKFESIIFSPTFNFMDNNFESWQVKSAGYNLDFLKSQTKVKNVIFDLSKKEDDKWDSNKFIHFVKFVYELLHQNQNTKIYFYHNELKSFLNQKKTKDQSFKLHLIYLINFYFNYKKESNQRIYFLEAEEQELKEFYNHYIQNEIDQVYVVDDLLFELSKRTFDVDLFYKHELENPDKHYPYFSKYLENEKSEIPLQKTYKAFFETIDVRSSRGPFVSSLDDKKLVLVLKKNALNRVSEIMPKNVKKYLTYHGSPLHHIKNIMQENEKKWKKIYDYYPEKIDKKLNEKLGNAARWACDHLLSSKELIKDENVKESFLFPRDKFSYLEKPALAFQYLKNLSHCWVEGATPFGGKYIRLDKLENYIPLENLEHLILSDCVAVTKLDLPYMPKLKILDIKPHLNHHSHLQSLKLDDHLRYFKNLPNLEELKLNYFNRWFTQGLSELDAYNDPMELWRDIRIDLSDLHELKKLKKVDLSNIRASSVNNMVGLPTVEKLDLLLFHMVERLKPDEIDGPVERPVNDSDLKFLKKSPKLKEIDLSIGNTAYKEDYNGYMTSCCYKGNGDFLDYISHKIKTLKLTINFEYDSQMAQIDIINRICNRFLKLEKLYLKFGVATTDGSFNEKVFNFDTNEYRKKLFKPSIDIKQFLKLKELKSLHLGYEPYNYLECKIINFKEIIKFKKITNIGGFFERIPFSEFRALKKLFDREKYEDPRYYDDYYDDLSEEEKKNWNRFSYINTVGHWEWDVFCSLRDEYERFEKKENEKKYKKPKQIIRNKVRKN